jgi:hypothetical protein
MYQEVTMTWGHLLGFAIIGALAVFAVAYYVQASIKAGRLLVTRWKGRQDKPENQEEKRMEEELKAAAVQPVRVDGVDQHPELIYPIPIGTPPSICGGGKPGVGCGATFYWVTTAAGKNMPVNPDGRPHWGTCPAREQFKRKGGNR